MTVVKVTGLDHIVLVVADVERSLAWYEDRFGMEPLRADQWRRGEAPFPSLRVNDGIIIDLIPGPRAGENVDHFCLVVDTDELEPVVASGRFDLVEGPSVRWGARGDGMSIYVRDPDGNVVELRHY
jgi:catechol 2,3-dioxygenase-like lactoylglutathione lyase family enzyme